MKEEMGKIAVITLSSELKRKEKLLHLFTDLEAQEKAARKKSIGIRQRYTRLVTDHGTIEKIEKNSVEWVRDNGERIDLKLTHQICKNLCRGDVIIMSIGLREGSWRIIYLANVISQICKSQIMSLNHNERASL